LNSFIPAKLSSDKVKSTKFSLPLCPPCCSRGVDLSQLLQGEISLKINKLKYFTVTVTTIITALSLFFVAKLNQERALTPTCYT
jgi:hypothetical protein